MRRLALLAVVLAAAVGVAELLAPSWVAARAETAVREQSSGRVEVDVDVSGPPLLVPVLASGQVESWSVRLTEVAGRQLPVTVVVDLDGVVLDRGRLLRGDVAVEEVDHARATVRLDLSGSVRPALRGMADRLAAAGLDSMVEGDGEALVLGELSIPLVPASCDVTSADLVVTARCELRTVPSFLLAPVD